MKTVKRATAAILAAVTTTAMAASISPAFAYENQDMAKEEFVQSFNEGIDRKCAQYLIDNGCALDEAMDIMDTYMEGLAMMEEQPMARAASNGYYYSSTNLAPTEHFALIIAVTPAYSANKVTIDVSANASLLSSTDSHFEYSYCSNYVNTVTHEYESANNMWNHSVRLSGINPSPQTEACSVIRYPIVPGVGVTTETAIRQNILFDVSTISNSEFALETYAKGDVNHDGMVNKADSTLLLQFLAEQTALDLTYADGSNHYSFVTNVAAADFNLDGIVSMVDIVKLDQYLASK